jgi:hypothetical protein
MHYGHTLMYWAAATTLALSSVSFAAAGDVPGEPAVDSAELISISGDGYTISEVPQPDENLDGMSLEPSPSGRVFLYHSKDECLIYSLSDSGLKGPWIYGEGSRTRDRKVYANPLPRWVLGPEGEEVFLLDVEEQRGLSLKDGVIVPWNTSVCSDYPPDWVHDECRAAASGLPCPMKTFLDAFLTLPYPSEPHPLAVKMVKEGGIYSTVELPVDYLRGVSHKRCAAVVYPRNSEHLVLVDFETSIARELDKPYQRTGHASYSSAEFSPDGDWILGGFVYGHASENTGGFLQLYDATGEHVRELATRTDDTQGAGWGMWLRNGWILYGDKKGGHFLHFEAR